MRGNAAREMRLRRPAACDSQQMGSTLYRPIVMSRLTAATLLLLAVAAVVLAWWTMIRMPGRSFQGTPPPLTAEEVALRDELIADVQKLGGDIGERNVKYYDALVAAADFVAESFVAAGFRPRREGYDARGKFCENIDVEIPGTSTDIFVVGAHYDSVFGSPGSNDNGSGVAALLALARRFAGKQNALTLRFVAFTNEEPFHFRTPLMGSWVYANRCKARGERIVGMISLETIGYYSNAPGSQVYPLPGLGLIYPRTGELHRLRRQHLVARAGAAGPRQLPRACDVTLRRSGAAGGNPRRRLVRSMGLLATRLSRDHDHRHGAVSISALPRAERYAG
jgi:hypothetical protein